MLAISWRQKRHGRFCRYYFMHVKGQKSRTRLVAMAKNILQLFRSLKDRRKKWPSRTKTILCEHDGWRTAFTAVYCIISVTERIFPLPLRICCVISRDHILFLLWRGYCSRTTSKLYPYAISWIRCDSKFFLFQQSQRGNNRFVRHPGPGVYCTINF